MTHRFTNSSSAKRDWGLLLAFWLSHISFEQSSKTHRHWRGPRKGSISGTRASACLAWTSQLTFRWRPVLLLCWTPWCTWWQSCLQPGPGSRTASRHGTPDPVCETRVQHRVSVQWCTLCLNIFKCAFRCIFLKFETATLKTVALGNYTVFVGAIWYDLDVNSGCLTRDHIKWVNLGKDLTVKVILQEVCRHWAQTCTCNNTKKSQHRISPMSCKCFRAQVQLHNSSIHDFRQPFGVRSQLKLSQYYILTYQYNTDNTALTM